MDAEPRGLIVAAAVLSLLAAVPVRAQLVTNTYIQASSATIVGNLGIGTSAAAARIDVRGGNIDMEQSPVEVFLASATQTSAVTTSGTVYAFTAIPGTATSITIPRTMIVNMRANGSVDAVTSTPHCGFAFVVDGVQQGYVDYGSTIVYAYAAGYWASWNAEIELSLASGTHTISLEIDANVASACYEDSNTYDAARLWIHGR